MNDEVVEKSRGFTSKITHISVVKFPIVPKIVRKYGQGIPQAQTADKPMAPLGRVTQQ